MNKLIIYQYINKLKYEDVVNYCKNSGIVADERDLRIVYKYIKNDYRRFFDNPNQVLTEVKGKVNSNTFREIMKLYDRYKNFI